MKQTVVTVNASPTVKRMWMAWMRQNHPAIYNAAVAQVIAPVMELAANASLGALGQDVTDLTTDPSLSATDLSSYAAPVDTSSLQLASDASQVNIPAYSYVPSTSSVASNALNSLFSTLVATTANVATNALTGNSAALVQLNAQRVSQGLPPLNPDGSVMSLAQMHAAGYNTSQIQQFESTLAGGMSTTTLLLIGGAVLAAVLLMGKRG